MVSLALTHDELSDIEEIERPDWNGLFNSITNLPHGKDNAARYEDLVEQLLTSLFYPSLCHPTKQHKIHEGRKRIDITYTNEAKLGFFAWLAQHYPCSFMFVECKNYGKEVGNPEIDQLSGRFSPSRGKVGILICRKIADRKLLMKRCIDTAKDDRGFILPLDDDDLSAIIESVKGHPDSQEFPLLRRLFRRLID
jgi:hypothetical protein